MIHILTESNPRW